MTKGQPVLAHFKKRLFASVNRSPLLRVRTPRTGRLLDCSRLSSIDPGLPRQLLASIINGDPPVSVVLRLRDRSPEPESLELFEQPQQRTSHPVREQMLLYEMLDKSMRRHADLAKRETGVHALWLGYPLIYVSSDVEEEFSSILAPVFLWPIFIEPDLRHEGRIKIGLAPNAGATRFNLAMSTWIRRQLNVDLPAPAEDQLMELDWNSVKDYMKDLAASFQDSPTINCEAPLQPVPVLKELEGGQSPLLFNSAFLGYCRWQHEAILADLDRLCDMEQYPEVASSFVTGASLTAPASTPPPSEEDRYVVCEADFSQEKVIWQARQEPGLVVHGPPGTGKSQTIVNIIADALAHNRKVLMVCQKQAATRVVLERLRAVGLADLCLEVHDAEGDRLTVFNAIREQVEMLPREAPQYNRSRRSQLAHNIADLENTLDRYAKALHENHHLIGISYRQMMGREGEIYAKFPSVRALTTLHQLLDTVPEQELDSLCKRVGVVGSLYRKADAMRNPWRFRQPTVQMSASLRSDVGPALEHLRTLDTQHQEHVQREGAGIQLPNDMTTFVVVAQQTIANLQPLLEGNDLSVSFAKTVRAGLRYFFTADEVESHRFLEKCRHTADLAKQVERNQPDPAWSEKCKDRKVRGLRRLWKRAEKTLSWRAKPFRFIIPSFLWSAHAIRKEMPDAKGDALWLVCEAALKHLYALDLRQKLADANRNLPTGLKPGGESTEVQVNFAKIILKGMETAFWLHEHGLKHTWLRPLLDLVLDAEQSPRLTTYIHDMQRAIRREPIAEQLLRVLGSLSYFLQPEGLEGPRNAVLAGEPLTDWLNSFDDGLSNLESLIGLEADRQNRQGVIKDILDALEKYEEDRLVGKQAPQPPDKLQPEEYGQWWIALVQYSATHAWQHLCRQEHPELITITPEQHANMIDFLKSLLQQKRLMESEDIKARWREKQIPLRDRQWKRMFQLRRSKLADAKRLREAIEISLPEGLLTMRPCWLVNPGAAAQLFPLKPGLFEVVIFDEASQCPIEQAIPAIYRGKVLIVAGDEKQLPPTSFFSARWDDDETATGEEDEEASSAAVEDRDIIIRKLGQEDLMQTEDLLEAAVNFLPERYLKVHYRSVHPALIDFSNRAFYGGRLEAPPSRSGNNAVVRPIFYHEVAGIYANRTNAKEADKVVEVLRGFWLGEKKCPTIGIVTFNLPQRDLIEDRIAEECRRNSAFAVRYQQELERKEANQDVGFFVKNLENVQGDERDVIMFSTTFGRDTAGAFYRRFGPVGARDGHRRLNVAVTRAKQQVIVVGSMPIDEISSALRGGVAPGRMRIPSDYLQLYLAYAQAVSGADQQRIEFILGMLASKADGGNRRGVPESPFEEEVYHALQDMNHAVHCQVGDIGFRIDLAVLHPEPAHGYILGIECDGATYHSDRSARIRDVWREEILKARGWRFHRIWSTQWWYHKNEEIAKLKGALQQALLASS